MQVKNWSGFQLAPLINNFLLNLSIPYLEKGIMSNCKARAWQNKHNGTKALAPLGRLTNTQLLKRNADYCFVIFFCYTLTLSIFPGFLAEDTGTHHLGTWYDSLTLRRPHLVHASSERRFIYNLL